MKIIAYTFRTFPHKNKLAKQFYKVFIFGKIKEDLEIFNNLILKEKPNLILGVALSNNNKSVFEPIATNKFNRNGIVDKNGKNELSLFTPSVENSNFTISSNPTTSFCNYTMYKIKLFLEKESIKIPFAFSHVIEKEVDELYLLLSHK